MRPNPEVPTHDGLIRIQNEISEVEKREIELRKEHELVQGSRRSNSVNGDSLEASSSPEPRGHSPTVVHFDSKDDFKKNKIIEPQPKPYLMAPVLTRASSTPQLFQVSPVKKFNINTPHKGIMEKFIASRGKMIGNQQYTTTQNNFKKNLMMSPIEFNNGSMKTFNIIEKPVAIERDVKGRPVRRGYIPVEEKIQSELRDLKSRECELKKLHKLNVSDDDYNSSDELDNSDWNPINGKLSKSIDALNGSSLSPTPEMQRPVPQPRNGFIRPAVSLAQLCDLDESDAPSSHKLIERWESIIQENQQREKSHTMH